MKLYHNIKLVSSFNEEKMPSSIKRAYDLMGKEAFVEVLNLSVISALKEINAIETINKNNSYAHVDFVSA